MAIPHSRYASLPGMHPYRLRSPSLPAEHTSIRPPRLAAWRGSGGWRSRSHILRRGPHNAQPELALGARRVISLTKPDPEPQSRVTAAWCGAASWTCQTRAPRATSRHQAPPGATARARVAALARRGAARCGARTCATLHGAVHREAQQVAPG